MKSRQSLTSMSASTSSTAPEPWGRCNKGCSPSLLSDVEAVLQQQQSAASQPAALMCLLYSAYYRGFHLHAMVHSYLILHWINACAHFRGNAGVVLEQHHPQGGILPPPGQHTTTPTGACFPVSVHSTAPGCIMARPCRNGGAMVSPA